MTNDAGVSRVICATNDAGVSRVIYITQNKNKNLL